MSGFDLVAAIEAANQLFLRGQTNDGVLAYDDLLASFPEERTLLLRARSQAYVLQDMFAEALDDRQKLIGEDRSSVADCYFAGEYALQCGAFDRSKDLFQMAADMSQRSGDSYYLQSSLLLAALASYQLRDDGECRRLLEQVDESTEVLWLKGFDKVTKSLMLQMLDKC